MKTYLKHFTLKVLGLKSKLTKMTSLYNRISNHISV